jgi:uroporphyrinogen-III decarboxylase
VKAKGFPTAVAASDWPPYDIIGDIMRGTMHILADMRRRPEMLHDALEIATEIFIEYGEDAASAELPFCWVWVHKSTRDDMSDSQFNEFCWPFFKKGLLALIDKGVIPVV